MLNTVTTPNYLFKHQEEASPAIEALKVVGDPLGRMAATLVEVRLEL